MEEDKFKYEKFKQFIPNYTSVFRNEPENENRERTQATLPKVPLFSKEESRILKTHITSELTKYVNNLKLEGEDIPYFYKHSQAGIGVATQLLYYCAAPFICQILIDDINPGLFVWLMMDPLFRKYWTQGEGSHVLNSGVEAAGEQVPRVTFDDNTLKFFKMFHPDAHITKEEYNKFKEIPGFGHTFTEVFNYRRIKLVTEYNQANRKNLTFSFSAHMRLIYNGFIARLRMIKEYCKTTNFKEAYTTKWYINLLETLRTIFIFYFKGGNSIRAIVDRFNEMERTHELKISNLDIMIPYGSDFDTNLIINPFLPQQTFLKIQEVIEIFIPQFSQFIILPRSFEGKLKNPPKENDKGEYIFKGADPKVENGKMNYGDEQQQQMRIIIDSYDLNRYYVGRREKAGLASKITELNTKPFFFLDPELDTVQGSISTKKSVRMECENLLDTIKCNISGKSSFAHVFPYDNSPGNPFLDYTANPINDKCLNALQYSLNLTIPKFRLHRYFLKFSLGEKAKNTVSKHRLIKVPDGHFNAEMLDISIVQPFYELDKTKTFYHCELYGLWADSLDIFKIGVQDQYNLYSHLTQFLPRRFDRITNTVFTIFINGLNMQINDLAEAISDTLEDKKYEKIPKRIKRLRLLQYILIVSPSYNRKFSREELEKEILGINKLINLEYPINKFNEKFPGLLTSEEKKYNVIKRIIDEYYSANFEHTFMKDDLIPKLTIKKAGQEIEFNVFVQEVLRKFVEENITRINWADNFNAINEYMPKLNKLFYDIFIEIIHSSIVYKEDSSFTYKFSQQDGISKTIGQYTITLKKLELSLAEDKINETISHLICDSNNDYRISPLLFHIVYKIYNKLKEIRGVDRLKNDIKFLMERIEGIPVTRENDVIVNEVISAAFASSDVEYSTPVSIIPGNQTVANILRNNSAEYINYMFKSVYTEYYCNIRKSYINFVEYYRKINPGIFTESIESLRPALIKEYIIYILREYSIPLKFNHGSLFNTTTDTFLNFFYFLSNILPFFYTTRTDIENEIYLSVRKFHSYKIGQTKIEDYLFETISHIIQGIEVDCFLLVDIHNDVGGKTELNLFKCPYESRDKKKIYYTKQLQSQMVYAIKEEKGIKLYSNMVDITELITSFNGYDYTTYGYNEKRNIYSNNHYKKLLPLYINVNFTSLHTGSYTIKINDLLTLYTNIMIYTQYIIQGAQVALAAQGGYRYTRRKRDKRRSTTGKYRSNK
jgi:hypothetical protein